MERLNFLTIPLYKKGRACARILNCEAGKLDTISRDRAHSILARDDEERARGDVLRRTTQLLERAIALQRYEIYGFDSSNGQ